MRKLLLARALLCVLSLVTSTSVAQTYTTITAGQIVDASGSPLAAGQITFQATDGNGKVIAFMPYQGGQAVTTPVSCNIAGGVITTAASGGACRLANTALTTPLNICFAVTITDNVTGDQLQGPGNTCFQPKGSTTSFDQYQPDTPAILPVVIGPQGPPGPASVTNANGSNGDFAVGGKLTAQVLGGVIVADKLPGTDVGVQINAAFQLNLAGRVTLTPGAVYTYQTTINFPLGSQTYPILDCQGATLNYTGSGDAVLVQPGGGPPYQSGLIQNCNLLGTAAAANGIHQESRVGMKYRNVQISYFTGATAAALLLDNTSFSGQTTGSSAGWNERLEAEITSYQNTYGIRALGNHGGTNSFAYPHIDLRCQLYDGERCLTLDGQGGNAGADMYGGIGVGVAANATFNNTAGRVIESVNGGSYRSPLVVNAESNGPVQGYGLYTDASSVIAACGVFLNGNFQNFNAGESSRQLLNTTGSECPSGAGATYQPPLFYLNVAQQRSWKYFVGPEGTDNYFGHNYIEYHGHSRWYTNTFPSGGVEVDGTGATTFATAEADGVFCVGSQCENIGNHVAPFQVNGASAVFSPVGFQLRSYITRAFDASGNAGDYLRSSNGPGQPSAHYYLGASDFSSGTEAAANLVDCYAIFGRASCTINGRVGLKALTTASNCVATPQVPNDSGPGMLQYVAGASGAQDHLQVCAKDATNAYAWRNVY